MTVCPFAAWKPVGNHGGGMSSHLGLVLHVQEGNGGLSGWFNNPSSGASSTFWVSKAGALEQYVDADLCAWAQASGNGSYNSVETEGYHTEALSAAQESMLAQLYAWGAQIYGWPNALAEAPGQAGFGWHGMGGDAWGGHYDCPGDLRKPRRQPILDAAFGAAPAPPPEQEDNNNMVLNDPDSGGYWVTDQSGRVYAYDGAPWLGACNNLALNGLGLPCVGIARYADPSGEGYTLLLDWGPDPGNNCSPIDGGDVYRRYRFPRDGSGAA